MKSVLRTEIEVDIKKVRGKLNGDLSLSWVDVDDLERIKSAFKNIWYQILPNVENAVKRKFEQFERVV